MGKRLPQGHRYQEPTSRPGRWLAPDHGGRSSAGRGAVPSASRSPRPTRRSGTTRLLSATCPYRAASLPWRPRSPLARGSLPEAEAARAPRGPHPAPRAITQLTVMRGSGVKRVRDEAKRRRGRSSARPRAQVASFARCLLDSLQHPRCRLVTSPLASTLSGPAGEEAL